MKAIIISGGGSKGAYAGGIAKYLVEDQEKNYDIFLGTSTGSLLMPFICLKKMDELKKIFCTISQEDIFDQNPFKIKKDPFGFGSSVGINHFSTFKQFLKRRKTFGESNNLRKLLEYKISKDMFSEIKNLDNIFEVTVSNLTTNEVEYKSIEDYDYDDFLDWIWISCNYIPFMSLVTKNYYEYADGGLGKYAPIKRAIELGATEIDAIILQTESQQVNYLPSRNAYQLIFRIFDYMMNQLYVSDLAHSKLEAIYKGVTVNYYHIPRILTNQSLVFEAKKLADWWEEGYAYAKKQFQYNEATN
jgi:predicted patatin/cPLA2 family phospholipase